MTPPADPAALLAQATEADANGLAEESIYFAILARDAANAGSDAATACGAWRVLCHGLYSLGRLEESIAEGRDCLAHARRHQLTEHIPAILAWLACLLHALGDREAAAPYWNETFHFLEANPGLPPAVTAHILANYGAILTDDGKLNESAEFYRRALAETARASGSALDDLRTDITANLAAILIALEQASEAESILRDTIKLLTGAQPVHRATVILHAHLAHALFLQSRNREALAERNAALALLNDTTELHDRSQALAVLLRAAHHFPEAFEASRNGVSIETLASEALDLARQTGKLNLEIEILEHLRDIHRQQGNHAAALDFFGKAIEIERRLRSEQTERRVRETQIAIENRFHRQETERLQELNKQTQAALALEQANRALLAEREALQAANLAKSAILGRVTHELLTPLNAVLGYTDNLLDDADKGVVPTTLAPDLHRIRDSAASLTEALSKILQAASAQAGLTATTLQNLTPADWLKTD